MTPRGGSGPRIRCGLAAVVLACPIDVERGTWTLVVVFQKEQFVERADSLLEIGIACV